MTVRVFVGTSPGSDDVPAERVLEYSLKKNSSLPVEVTFMRKESEGFFSGFDDSQWFTPFSAFRWCIPELCDFEGRAIYMDVDQVNFRDIAELWNMDLGDAAFACKPGGRTCVMVMDCAKMKEIVDPVSVIRQRADYSTYAFQKFTKYATTYDTRWNCLDGEDLNPFDIYHLHFTHMPTQPWSPSWAPAVHAKHDIPFNTKEHPRKDLTELWWRFLQEANKNTLSTLASPEYRSTLIKEHATTKWGVAAASMIDRIIPILDKYSVTETIDYGAGQCGFRKSLETKGKGITVIEYDPGVPALAIPPNPSDFLVCIDVLEHVEPDLLGNVFEHMQSLVKKNGFLSISTIPAQRILNDGRNAHLIVQEPQWWIDTVAHYFNIEDTRIIKNHSVELEISRK